MREFLSWAEREATENADPQARAKAEIGIATARQYLDKLEPEQSRIITDSRTGENHD